MCIHEIGKKKQTQVENHFSNPRTWKKQTQGCGLWLLIVGMEYAAPLLQSASRAVHTCALLLKWRRPIEAAQLNLSMPSRCLPLGSDITQDKLQPNHIF